MAESPYKFLFKVDPNLELIKEKSACGVFITVDPACKYACAHFTNSIDYNNFKALVTA